MHPRRSRVAKERDSSGGSFTEAARGNARRTELEQAIEANIDNHYDERKWVDVTFELRDEEAPHYQILATHHNLSGLDSEMESVVDDITHEWELELQEAAVGEAGFEYRTLTYHSDDPSKHRSLAEEILRRVYYTDLVAVDIEPISAMPAEAAITYAGFLAANVADGIISRAKAEEIAADRGVMEFFLELAGEPTELDDEEITVVLFYRESDETVEIGRVTDTTFTSAVGATSLAERNRPLIEQTIECGEPETAGLRVLQRFNGPSLYAVRADELCESSCEL